MDKAKKSVNNHFNLNRKWLSEEKIIQEIKISVLSPGELLSP